MPNEIVIEVPMQIKEKDIADLLCCAFEGGTNYWAELSRGQKPDQFEFRSDESQIFWHVDWPMNAGGSIKIHVTEEAGVNGKRNFVLDRKKLVKGLQVMAEKYPKHFSNFIGDHSDAETGDVFVQCALFGELIFG